ncbi:hypothetical protein [Streptomyces sp.]|uniref:hypothetical protein n=1 Tax=Streptomyces sp. TaxID=1931 RepID=UPI002D78507D|nr:hypothetical protein [Streptomyces sp.]HET6354257.1 hypothetical protein [Streptomyces sp.]
MNALTALAPRGLTWAVLRLHRSALLVAAGLLTAGAAGLLWLHAVGLEAARAHGPCGSSDTDLPPCQDFTGTAVFEYVGNMRLTATMIAWLPLAVALYAGGVLIGRELERGTAALSWTQSVTPARWLVAKLLIPALLITTGMGLLSLLYRLARHAGATALGDEWYMNDVFLALGPAGLAYSLLALAVGALAGVLLRRALPAGGLALAATGLVMWLCDRWRDQLWPRVDLASSGPRPEVASSVWQLENGVVTSTDQRIQALTCWGPAGRTRAECRAGGEVREWYAVFHPSSHFWPIQLVETGIVLALTAALTAAAFVVLRRRHA